MPKPTCSDRDLDVRAGSAWAAIGIGSDRWGRAARAHGYRNSDNLMLESQVVVPVRMTREHARKHREAY